MSIKNFSKALIVLLCLAAIEIYAAESPRITPTVKVIKEWAPSVVNISTERIVNLRTHPFWGQYGSLLDEFYNQYAQSIPLGTMKFKSLGSGVIISKEGLILTNAHVVQMANKIYVILHDGTESEASLVAVKPTEDLALIKIAPPKELKPVRFANDVMIGETVIAIGNPFGLENSVTSGIVSGLNRQFAAPAMNIIFRGLIQTDASINPGSSGGALFNLEGDLIGLNLAVVQNAQNIGFAIPFSKIKDMLKEYEEALRQRAAAIKIPVQ